MAEVAPGMSKIFVRYRNSKPSGDEMREIFSKHGTITDVKLYAKFCFIEYDSEVAAELAVAAENGTVFKDVKLEVETVVRNVEKRKPDETVAEASASTKEVTASKPEEAPSADNAVKKFKQDVSPADVLTKDSSANEATNAKAAIAAEYAQGKQEFQSQADVSEDVAESNEAPHLGAGLPVLTQRRYRARKPRPHRHSKALSAQERGLQESLSTAEYDHRVWKHKSTALKTQEILQESISQAEYDYLLQSKSNERYAMPSSALQASSEDKLSTAHADHSLSASYGRSDQPPNSCGPSPAYPDYAPPQESVPPVDYNQPPVDYHQYGSTTYNWSGYPPAEQTYTTAYPPADSWSYSSNYTAECSQVTSSCRPATSYYGSYDTDARSLKQNDRPVLAQGERPWNDERVIQEGYSVRGDPSGPGKADRPHLPDLVNYSSVQSVAKASASDLKARESRDPGYGSSLESRKTPSSQGATKSAQVVTSVAESQGREKTDSAIEHSGVCELIITDPNLRQYGLKVASKIHSSGLKVEICNLPPGMTVIEEVEDALIRGLLFAVVITERHVEHNSVTVDVLHGVAEEHRNMVLDDAVRLIATSYQDYLTAKRASAKSSAVSESSKDTADVVPNERTQKLIIALARNQRLTYEELEEIVIYLRKRQEALKKESSVVVSLPGQNTVVSQQQIESVDVELQRKLEATIFGILKGEAPVQQQGTRTKPTQSGSYLPAGHYADTAQQQGTSSKPTQPGSYLPAGHYADTAQQQGTSSKPTQPGSYLPSGHYADPAQQHGTSSKPTQPGSYLPTGHYADPAQQQGTISKPTQPGSYLPAGHYADPAQQQGTSTKPTHSGSYLPTGHYADPAQQQGTSSKPTQPGSYLPAGHYADPAQQQGTSSKPTQPGSYLPTGHYADPAQQQGTSSKPTQPGSYIPAGHYADPAQQQGTSTKPTHPGSYLPSGHYADSGDPYASNDYRRY